MDRFEELKALVAIAETGGFARAAARLHRSPPAVTRTIAALESRLGVELLARTTRSVRLTDAGRVFLERARGVLAELDQAETEAGGETSAPAGHLTITTSVTMGRTVMAPLVLAFLDAQPRVRANLVLLDRVVNLVEEGIDVALRIGALADSTLIARKVGEVRRLLVASPGYLARHGAPRAPADLHRHAIIDFTGLMPNREWSYTGDRGTQRVALNPRLEVNDAFAAIAAAEAGAGITAALSYMVAAQIRKRRLVPVLLGSSPPAVPVQLVYPETRIVAPKLRSFIDFAAPRLGKSLAALRLGAP